MGPGRVRMRQLCAVLAATTLLTTACGAGGSSGTAGSESNSAAASTGGSAGGSGAPSSDDPYQILAFLPLSGPLAAVGEANRGAAEAAVSVLNANGGIAGRQVTLTVQDDKGDPAEAANLAQAAVMTDDLPDLVVPGGTSTEVAASLPILTAAGVLSAGSASSKTFQPADQFLYWGASPSVTDGVRGTLSKLQAAGYKSMGLVVIDNELGATTITAYQDNAAEFGIQVVGVEKLAADAVDATPQAVRLKDSNPDAIVLSMYGTPNKPFLEARTELGWTVPIYADQVSASAPLAQFLTPEQLAEMNLVVVPYVVEGNPIQQGSAIQTAHAALNQALGNLKLPIAVYLHGYYPIILAKYAVEAAGSTDATAVHDGRLKIASMPHPLYAGSSEMFNDPASNYLSFPPDDWTVVKGGPLDDGFITAGS